MLRATCLFACLLAAAAQMAPAQEAAAGPAMYTADLTGAHSVSVAGVRVSGS